MLSELSSLLLRAKDQLWARSIDHESQQKFGQHLIGFRIVKPQQWMSQLVFFWYVQEGYS